MLTKIQNYNNQPSFGTFKAIGNFTSEEENMVLKPIREFSKQKFQKSKRPILSTITSFFSPEIHVVIKKSKKQCGSFIDKTFNHCYDVMICPLGNKKKCSGIKPKDFIRLGIPSFKSEDLSGNIIKTILQHRLNNIYNDFNKRDGFKCEFPEDVMKVVIKNLKDNFYGTKKVKYVIQTGEG